MKRAHHTADALKLISVEKFALHLSLKCKTRHNKRRPEQVTAALLLWPENVFPLNRRRQVLHGRQSALGTHCRQKALACVFLHTIIIVVVLAVVFHSNFYCKSAPYVQNKRNGFFFNYSCTYIYSFIPLGLNFLVFFLSTWKNLDFLFSLCFKNLAVKTNSTPFEQL